MQVLQFSTYFKNKRISNICGPTIAKYKISHPIFKKLSRKSIYNDDYTKKAFCARQIIITRMEFRISLPKRNETNITKKLPNSNLENPLSIMNCFFLYASSALYTTFNIFRSRSLPSFVMALQPCIYTAHGSKIYLPCGIAKTSIILP